MRDLLRWATTPTTESSPRHHVWAITALRVLAGLMWLYNVSWKTAPDFGRESGRGLWRFTNYAVDYPVFPPYSWVVEHLVLPNFTPFAWGVLAAETTLAVLLLTGAWVRLAALLGLAQSTAIALSVAFAPNEWPWSYWLMIGVHLTLLLSASGRAFAVDGVRAGLTRPSRLAAAWGGFSVVVGLYSVLASLGDPLDARGPGLRSTDLSVSLGEYNLVGGLVVLGCGLLLLLGTQGVGWAPRAAAGLAMVGAVLLYAQMGFTEPLLGGTPTSAAFLLCLAVVGLAGQHPRWHLSQHH